MLRVPHVDDVGEKGELTYTKIGDAVTIKDGYVALSAVANTESSKSQLNAGLECWFMGVARAERARSNFLYFALLVPAFKTPDEWPEPPSAAMHLIQLEGIEKGKHTDCENMCGAHSRLLVLQGLVAPDITWRTQSAVSAALARAQATIRQKKTNTNSGKKAAPSAEEGTSAKKAKKGMIPDDMRNWGFTRLVNASTPELDRVRELFARLP